MRRVLKHRGPLDRRMLFNPSLTPDRIQFSVFIEGLSKIIHLTSSIIWLMTAILSWRKELLLSSRRIPELRLPDSSALGVSF